jgi:MFS family permease
LLGGLGIVPVSGLWLISNSFAFLLLVQVIAGVTWAAYELAMFLLFFETIRAEERTSILTSYNFANSMATVAGSLLGGALLATCGKTEQVYLSLFALSSVARALTLFALLRVPDIVPEVLSPITRVAPEQLSASLPSSLRQPRSLLPRPTGRRSAAGSGAS